MLGVLQHRLGGKAVHWRILARAPSRHPLVRPLPQSFLWDIDRKLLESRFVFPLFCRCMQGPTALHADAAGRARIPTLHAQVRLFSARRSVKQPNGLRCIVDSLHGGEWRDEEMGSCCVRSSTPRGLVRDVRSEFVAVW